MKMLFVVFLCVRYLSSFRSKAFEQWGANANKCTLKKKKKCGSPWTSWQVNVKCIFTEEEQTRLPVSFPLTGQLSHGSLGRCSTCSWDCVPYTITNGGNRLVPLIYLTSFFCFERSLTRSSECCHIWLVDTRTCMYSRFPRSHVFSLFCPGSRLWQPACTSYNRVYFNYQLSTDPEYLHTVRAKCTHTSSDESKCLKVYDVQKIVFQRRVQNYCDNKPG